MKIETFTNTLLAAHRRCPRELELRYGQRLDMIGDKPEALSVGTAWHRAFLAEAEHDGISREAPLSSYALIRREAPSALWAEKLSRLYAGHAWRWRDENLDEVETEKNFRIQVGPHEFEGQIDGVLVDELGRRGMMERKTTSESLDAESQYWEKLRLDTQVGIYGMALERPAFIVYDVVRKPTINPKRIVKADQNRLAADLKKHGAANYFQEIIDGDDLADALATGRESVSMYGARLAADIGDRPEYYFQRRLISRTSRDYDDLEQDILEQADAIRWREQENSFPRNPDACNAFGRCAFFGLCSNGIHPDPDGPAPDGFVRRDVLHPELQPVKETNDNE